MKNRPQKNMIYKGEIKKMTKKRTDKGITLIALVITIIVLLILAAVSIATLTGENGILTQATKAEEKTQMKSLSEEAKLVITEKTAEEMTGGKEQTLLERLEKGISGNKTIEKAKEVPNIYYVTREGQKVTVYEDGTIEEGKVSIWDGKNRTKPTVDENKNWHIYTAEELKYFADFVNGKLTEEEKGDLSITETTTVYLENNIDLGARQKDGELKSGTKWTEIGTNTTNSFVGIFEGNNHFVRGMYVEKEGDYVGLFGYAKNIIKNLTLKDSYVIGKNDVGGIVGYATGNIVDNCINEAEVIGKGNCVGGVIGESDNLNLINDCINKGMVMGNAGFIGGIGGKIEHTTVSNCSNIAIIKQEFLKTPGITAFPQDVGGIVGIACNNSAINNCYNTGDVYGTRNFVGGIVGRTLSKNDISFCYNSGIVNGSGVNIGGIVGIAVPISQEEKLTLTKCYNKGKIEGTSEVGSILGGNSNSSIPANVTNSYYLSSVGVGAINGADDESKKVMSTTEDIKSYEEFINWIENK